MVTTKLHTVADLWDLGAEQTNYELIEGELVEVTPVKHGHGTVQLRIGSRILAFVESHHLGEVSTEEGFFLQRDPDTVLGPDVAFTRNERLAPEGKYWSDLPPDLAVEVVSPANTRADIDRKVRIYLSAGVRLVWIVRTRDRTITVHKSDSQPQTLSEHDMLTGGDVLPGFEMPVADIFGK